MQGKECVCVCVAKREGEREGGEGEREKERSISLGQSDSISKCNSLVTSTASKNVRSSKSCSIALKGTLW